MRAQSGRYAPTAPTVRIHSSVLRTRHGAQVRNRCAPSSLPTTPRTAWEEGSLDVLVWVTASARSPVVTGYAQAGVELCRATPDAARTFLAWLAPKARAKPCRRLIVLDDVGDPDDLRGLWQPASPLAGPRSPPAVATPPSLRSSSRP